MGKVTHRKAVNSGPLDIRTLVKVAVGQPGALSYTELSKKIGTSPSTLNNILTGIISLSTTFFDRIVVALEVNKDPRLLQTWMAAYTVEKFGDSWYKWLKLAGWEYSPDVHSLLSECMVQDAEDRAQVVIDFYKRLSVSAEVGERRLRELLALRCREKVTVQELQKLTTYAEICAIRSDMCELEKLGYATRKTLVDKTEGRLNQPGRKGTVKRTHWDITSTGAMLVEEAEQKKVL